MMYYLPMIMYRTKSPIPKSKLPPKEKTTRPVPPEDLPIMLKLTLIPGLKSIVLDEIAKYPEMKNMEISEDKIYLDFIADYKNVKTLRSITNAYVVKRGEKFNTYYISNHKSILGELIDIVKEMPRFKTFKLRCAGADSKEVREIQSYITNTYKMRDAEDADMEIYISKPSELWEISIRLTPRPLTLRDYKVANIKGGMNPTIAYALNTFCNLKSAKSYLNVFSGSGTLLIEAGITNPDLKLVGFDIDGKNNALAIQNIKKAGLIKQIHLKTADIYNKPHLGKFDIIASDLPFGMQISSKENLNNLYQNFVSYCEETLNDRGSLLAYTTEHKILQPILESSKFEITKTIDLVIPTAVAGTYLYPRIFVCKFR